MIVRVVLIDDDSAARRVLRRVLQKHSDIKVVGEADGGSPGLAVVDETRPDVVIIDYRMPDIDGAETTRKLLAARPELHVIGHSGDSANESVMRAAGATAFVPKTAPIAELVQAIRHFRPTGR